MVRKVVSGGQTGADRAALDAAIELGLETGGWVPRGRRAEDGPIADRYAGLVETESAGYEVRTERNVRDADATLIFSFGRPTGGTALTIDLARALDRPHLVIDLEKLPRSEAVTAIRDWLARLQPAVLNVAGPRASGEPRVFEATHAILIEALGARPGARPTRISPVPAQDSSRDDRS